MYLKTHPCRRCSKGLCPGERQTRLTPAHALPAPSISLYLGRSCSTSQSLSRGDGRGTQWGRSPAGSPGGRPDRCTGCRARVRRNGRLGATPPRGSMSSHHARRLHQGGQEGREGQCSQLPPESRNRWGWGLGEPLLHQSGPATLPAKWRPGHKAGPTSLTSPHLSTQGWDVPSKDLWKMESPSPALRTPRAEQGAGAGLTVELT